MPGLDLEVTKEHLKYIAPYLPANILIAGTSFVTSKLFTKSGGPVIAALPYIYGFYGLVGTTGNLFVGTGVSVANVLGKNQPEKINTILKQSMMIAAGTSIPFLILLYKSGDIIKLTGATNDVVEVVQTHINQFGWGVPLYFINMGLSQITIPFSTTPSSLTLILTNISNCAFSFLFIPMLPIAGTALASSVSNLLTTLGLSGYMLSQAKYREILSNNTDHSHGEIFKGIMNTGLPAVLSALSQMASSIVASATIGKMLDNTALQQQGLTIMPMAFLQELIANNADAAAVLISRQMGARRYSEIQKYVNVSQVLGALSGIMGTILIGSVAESYIRYFVDPRIATSEFVATARNILLLAAINQTISSVGLTSVAALKGMGENWGPLLINLGLKFGLNLAGSFLLAQRTNLGAYSPYVSDLIISSLFYAPSLFYYCKRKIDSFTNQPILIDQIAEEMPVEENTPRGSSIGSAFLGWLYGSKRTAPDSVEMAILEDSETKISREVLKIEM